ncbi:pyridine nucleotide-disulfide oxidoreductase [Nonomuraea polychroma]|uniref:Pyridine nucleotide-disulfide oxidoreductase n=1 Tax=Nonomuraea polychroma TaxID=46176 RepID=A0A438M6J2_9ACTN|nr:pyridine nucleotide-disulfide oxidoreductase [Nonomuraea polychroma]
MLVVGASTGDLAVTEALRSKGYDGRIRLVGQERHSPYDRPPLSKEILAGSWPAERAFLRAPAELDALRAEFILGRRAEGLDVEARTVDLDDGRTLSYDVLVVATGLIPRRFPGQRHLAGVHTLHTLHDADDLRRRLASMVGRSGIGRSGVVGVDAEPGAFQAPWGESDERCFSCRGASQVAVMSRATSRRRSMSMSASGVRLASVLVTA